jgi:hypothetical protein
MAEVGIRAVKVNPTLAARHRVALTEDHSRITSV